MQPLLGLQPVNAKWLDCHPVLGSSANPIPTLCSEGQLNEMTLVNQGLEVL
jgi:hypothetical protein